MIIGKRILSSRKIRQWQRDGFGLECAECESRKENGVQITIDHIVPMTILLDFGLSVEETFDNFYLQPLCEKCNKAKGNHIKVENPRTEKILHYLLYKGQK